MSRDKNVGNKIIYKIGFWAALLSAIFAIMYIIVQFAEFANLLEPAGSPLNLIALMAPSFVLAPSFVILMVSIHYYASEDKKIWSHIGLSFAIIYAVLILIVYYTQLFLVVPRLIEGRIEDISLLLLIPHDSFLFAIDLLGYGFMNLATLFVAFVFERRKLEGWIRRFLIANGLLAPANILWMIFQPLFYIAALWVITFPLSTIMLAILFRRAIRTV